MHTTGLTVRTLSILLSIPFAGLLAAFGVSNVDASCDVIPSAVKAFPGTLATVDRPFASPGDWVKLSLNPECHAASPGFSRNVADQVVTVVFRPLDGARNVVLLATDCAAVEVARLACQERSDVSTATCIQ